MSFPILVSHIGFIETIIIPIFHSIFGGYKLYKIEDYQDRIKIFQHSRIYEDFQNNEGIVQG